MTAERLILYRVFQIIQSGEKYMNFGEEPEKRVKYPTGDT